MDWPKPNTDTVGEVKNKHNSGRHALINSACQSASLCENDFANSIPPFYETYFAAWVRLLPYCDVASPQRSIWPITGCSDRNTPRDDWSVARCDAGTRWGVFPPTPVSSVVPTGPSRGGPRRDGAPRPPLECQGEVFNLTAGRQRRLAVTPAVETPPPECTSPPAPQCGCKRQR
jgi:hypothetical protein